MNQIASKSANFGASVASMGTAARGGDELREWLRLLNRRKVLIVGVGLIVVALTALILAQLVPLYRASARVMLDTRKFKMVNTEAALSGVDMINVGALQTELEIMKSEDLLGRVVGRLGLMSKPGFNGTRKADFVTEALAPVRMAIATLVPPSCRATPLPAARPGLRQDSDPRRSAAIGVISSRLTATLVGRTFIILFTAETPNDGFAQIANAIADMYLVDQLDAKYEANKRATEWLEERLSELRRSPGRGGPGRHLSTRQGHEGQSGGDGFSQTLSDLNGNTLLPAPAMNARRLVV